MPPGHADRNFVPVAALMLGSLPANVAGSRRPQSSVVVPMRNLYLATAVLLGLTIVAALANAPLGPDFATGTVATVDVLPDVAPAHQVAALP
jgi:hypothetical protein